MGADIADVRRFRKLPYGRNKSFYSKVFTDAEIRHCLAKQDPYPHFAARFAAKEAVAKAMNFSVYKAKNVEIVNDKTGKPEAKIKDRKSKTKNKLMVSLSHTKDQAIAIALWLN